MTIYLSNRDGNGKTSEEGHYKFQTAVFSGNALGATGLLVKQNSPLSRSVLVSAGQYKIDTSADYSYTGWNTADEVVNISVADGANPRLTSIVLYVEKDEPTSPSPPNNPNITKLIAVDGTPAAIPVAPNSTTIQSAVGAGNPYIILANVRVNAGATQITNANITDTRQRVTLGTALVSQDSLLDGAVATAKLADLAVTEAKIAANAVTTGKIVDAAVTDAKWRAGVAFLARRTSSLTVTGETTIVYNSEDFDIGNNYDTTNGRFTAPYAGIYIFHAHMYTEATSTNRSFCNIYKNGSLAQGHRGIDIQGTRVYRTESTTIMSLNAGDYVQGGGYSATGTNVAHAQTYFTGALLTRT